MEVKRLFALIILIILLIVSVLLGLSDTHISVADIGIPDNQVIISEGNNASATATITITMTGALNE